MTLAALAARWLIAIPIGAVGLGLLALGAVDFWGAAFGDTGDTSPQVPLAFGVAFALAGGAATLAAFALWRRAGR